MNLVAYCRNKRGFIKQYTIRRHILAFVSEKRAEISKETCESMCKYNSAISITIDEWTSIAVKRYFGVNFHLHDTCWHL